MASELMHEATLAILGFDGDDLEMDPAQKAAIMGELRGLVLSNKKTATEADANFGGKKPLF